MMEYETEAAEVIFQHSNIPVFQNNVFLIVLVGLLGTNTLFRRQSEWKHIGF